MKSTEKAIIRTTEILSVAIDVIFYIALAIVTAIIIGVTCFYSCLISKAAEDPVALYSSAESVFAEVDKEDGYYYEAFFASNYHKGEYEYSYCVLRFPKTEGFFPVIYFKSGGPSSYNFRVYSENLQDFNLTERDKSHEFEVLEPFHKEGAYSMPYLNSNNLVVNFHEFSEKDRNTLIEFYGDMYVFGSESFALDYCRNGDKSGIIQQPNGDYSKRHDFSGDTYDADMPVPQLSHFSHNGFTVNNASDDLFLDIIVESKFHGVMHNLSGLKFYLVNKSWVYGSHYYNLTERSHIAVNASKIDIKELYGVDNEAALLSDFQKWSGEYPTHNKLPDYNFWKFGSLDWGVAYAQHLYSADDEKTLANSRQAQTTYYVRFYDKNMNYGKWLSYTYSENGVETGEIDTSRPIIDPTVEVGDVVPDGDGNPIVQNPNKGKQDPNTGDIDYNYNNGIASFDFSDLWATIKSLVVSMGEVPDLIGHVFSFLPQWVLYMIAAGIAGIIALRFAGR